MLKTCDICDASFDVFNEGYVSDYNNAFCAACWRLQSRSRGIKSLMNGGVK